VQLFLGKRQYGKPGSAVCWQVPLCFLRLHERVNLQDASGGQNCCAAPVGMDSGPCGLMKAPVAVQATSVPVCLSTALTQANEGLAFSMATQVPFQGAKVRKALCAARMETGKRPGLRMLAQVLHQSGCGNIPPGTALLRAGKGFFDGVQAQVSFQTVSLGEPLGAVPE